MYDCIIIGAGPAGGTSAYHLAKRGHSVLVLDKEKLPRYKPCGGGVSPIIQEWFDFDFTPAISLKSKTIHFTWQQNEVKSIDMTDNPIWMVRRDEFDYFLIQQAVKQGAKLQDETEVTEIEFQQDSWRIKTNYQEFSGRYLIGADGGKGKSAKWLGFPKQKTMVVGALEFEIPCQNQVSDETYVELGLLTHGYAWNFPKANGFSVGAYGLTKKTQSQNLNRIIHNYSSLFNLNADTGTKQGHPIALWHGKQKLHTEKALLAGESACVVDPFTAEGIRPSIFSGLKAANAISESLGGDINALSKYSEIMATELGNEMKWADRLSQVFYRIPRLSFEMMVKHPTASKTMIKIINGKSNYSQVANKGINLLTNSLTEIITGKKT